MNEIWKPVRQFEGTHEISNLGRVRRLIDFKGSPGPFYHKISVGNTGHPQCYIKNFETKALLLVAQEVLKAFGGAQRPCKIRFKDGNRLNCSIDNLECQEMNTPTSSRVKKTLEETRYPERDCIQCKVYPCFLDRNNQKFNHKTHFAADGCINYKKR